MRERVRFAAVFAIAAGSMIAAPDAEAQQRAGSAAPGRGPGSAVLKRGKELVTLGGCNDCHTPWKMGAKGPEQDMSRMLSGHPQDLDLPPPPAAAGPWTVAASHTFTAWAGPWGVSYAANLTPDPETGIGRWTEQNFIETMRTGRHMGRGRPILPPMPWFNLAKASDADLKAMFAYLRSVPAIENRVPEPAPPLAAREGGGEGGTAAGAGAPPAQEPQGGAAAPGVAPQR